MLPRPQETKGRPQGTMGVEISIGLLGLGVVGSSVAKALLDENESRVQKVGGRIRLKKILVRDPAKVRPTPIPQDIVTTEFSQILDDPEINIVVELMGGEQPATDYIRKALAAGKHLVTANKEVMAKHGPELLGASRSNDCYLSFEASVGAGIPIIAPLSRDLLANDICSIRAIVNGTTNYIVTRMAKDHTGFDEALREAQERGFAEADPTNDIQGNDASYKLAILASLAFHTKVLPEDIFREGISGLEAQDFRYSHELGYAIKLLAIARRENDSLQLRVHPSLVPQEHILASVDGAFNAIEVEGNLMGRVLFHGMGAGSEPTASAVIGDVIEVARRVNLGIRPLPIAETVRSLSIAPMSDLTSRYYFRLSVADRSGVLARIAKVLGDRDISIASVIQKDSDPRAQTADLVVTTHPAKEDAVQESLQCMVDLDVVKKVGSMVRMEE